MTRFKTLFWGLALLVMGLGSAARADEVCLNPESLELVAIQFANNVNIEDRSLILHIAIRYEQYPDSDFTTQMPGNIGFLKLDANHFRRFSSPIHVENARFTRIIVTVIEVPSDISQNALTFVFAGLKGLAGAALDHAFQKQPLIGLFADPFVDQLTDEIREEIERGYIFAMADSTAQDASVVPYIQPDDGVFRVFVKQNCSEFQKSLN